jgi:hypothetical protein
MGPNAAAEGEGLLSWEHHIRISKEILKALNLSLSGDSLASEAKKQED